jgi:hypothetical protein
MRFPLFLLKRVLEEEYTNRLYGPFHFLIVVFGSVDTQGPTLSFNTYHEEIYKALSHFSSGLRLYNLAGFFLLTVKLPAITDYTQRNPCNLVQTHGMHNELMTFQFLSVSQPIDV